MEILLQLPEELQAKIGSYLDDEVFLDFLLSDPKILDNHRRFFNKLKFRILSQKQAEIIMKYGPIIQKLDLNYSYTDGNRLHLVISSCEFLRELNIVNTRLTMTQIKSIIEKLAHLKKLSLSIKSYDADSMDYPPNSSIEQLYIEVASIDNLFNKMARLVNSLEKLRWLHLYLSREYYGPELRGPREVVLDRMETIIISPRYGSSYDMNYLIHDFFPFMDYHFDYQASCFIRHKGMINSTKFWIGKPVSEEFRNSILLESWVLDCDIPYLPGHGRVISCPVGNPKRLNVIHEDFSLENLYLEKSLADNLVELNLTDVHCKGHGRDLSKILASTRSLRALSIPNCVFLGDAEGEDGVRVACVWLSIAESRLQKVHVNGCRRCFYPRFRVKSNPFLKFDETFKLEELSLIDVSLPEKYLRKLASRTLKCFRIVSSYLETSMYALDLRYFLRNSPSLEFFKIEDEYAVSSDRFWKVLGNCSKLKEVCLDGFRGHYYFNPIINAAFSKLKNLRSFHIHQYDGEPQYAEYDELLVIPGIRILRTHVETNEVRYIAERLVENFDEWDFNCYTNRMLCSFDNDVGHIPSEGWC